MSILINMELPHACMDCIMSNLECDWCILLQSNIPQESRFEKRMKQCPLVPVPPHGRLVDADRLLSEHMKRKYYHLPNGDTAIPIIDVEHAPTIIEADESDMDSFIRILKD